MISSERNFYPPVQYSLEFATTELFELRWKYPKNTFQATPEVLNSRTLFVPYSSRH